MVGETRRVQVGTALQDGIDRGEAEGTATRLRVRLKSPEAFLILSGGSVPSASTLIGIMQSISATPRIACGRKEPPKAQSRVIAVRNRSSTPQRGRDRSR